MARLYLDEDVHKKIAVALRVRDIVKQASLLAIILSGKNAWSIFIICIL
ncbi:MAG: hypothetical protein E3K37_02930 [Candidatus Kuenenia sp.]|nr:hypothetical protein [Candidatus Kuenenia hertensis]